MNIVVDANVLIGALLRDGAVRHRVFTSHSTLCAPGFLREELDRHIDQLAKRAEIERGPLEDLLSSLFDEVRWITDDRIEANVEQALKALGDVDSKDVAYLACALAIDAAAIWSFDTDFDEQDLVPRTEHPDVTPG